MSAAANTSCALRKRTARTTPPARRGGWKAISSGSWSAERLSSVVTLLLLFSVWHWNLLSAVVPAAIPLGLALLYALAFRQGKPSGYDIDLFELWLKGSGFGPEILRVKAPPLPFSSNDMFETAPNGYFMRDLIVFHGLRKGCYVSKGFIIEPPDLSAAAPEHLNAFQDQLSLLLACLHDNLRLQVQWFCDSDYRADLLRYHEQTERATNVWTRRCRNERFSRYWQAMIDRRLRRQRLVLFFSRRSRRRLDHRDGRSPAFALRRVASANDHGVRAAPPDAHQYLSGRAHHADEGRRSLPALHDLSESSLGSRFDYDTLETFDSAAFDSGKLLAQRSARARRSSGFWMDGYYHSLLVLSRWPSSRIPASSIVSRSAAARLHHHGQRRSAFCSRRDQTRRESARPHRRRLRQRKENLAAHRDGEEAEEDRRADAGTDDSVQRDFIIRAWDKTRDGLNAKAGAIKNAINSMNAAQYFDCEQPATTSKNLFFQTWPGWTWGRYEHRKLYAETRFLADMLPVSARSPGIWTGGSDLRRPSAQSCRHNDFLRSQGQQNAATRGVARHVRRGEMCHRLRPAFADGGFFGYTVIIEEGLSYGIYTARSKKARPIIIHPDGDLTINYLDTKGLPLTPDHLSAATALVARMRASAAMRTNRCSARRRSPNTSTCFTRMPSRIGAKKRRPAARHRPARLPLAEIAARIAPGRDHPRNLRGLPRLAADDAEPTNEQLARVSAKTKRCAFLKEPEDQRKSATSPSPTSRRTNFRRIGCFRN